MARQISAHYDPEADALQIALEPSYRVDKTTEEGGMNGVNLDWQDGRVVGVEILRPTKPLRLARIAAKHGFADLLDDIYAVAGNATGISVGANVKLGVCEAWWTVADAA